MDPAPQDQSSGSRRALTRSGDRASPIEHSRLASGCLWGVPLSLGLWALIFYALWRLLTW